MQKLTRLYNKFFLLFLIIILTFNFIIIGTVISSPEKIMEIISEDEINEGKNFSVSVLDPELFSDPEAETPYLSNVQIEFNGENYFIDDSLEVTINAPEVTQNEILTITASKENYTTAYKNLTIINSINKKLEIIHDSYIVDAGNKFSVQIVDEDGNPVSGAEVYIQNSDETLSITNEKGYATLKAPDNLENFVIVAKKGGYDYVTQNFSVNIQPSIWDVIFKNQLFPIFIGAILLISAIVFVNFRQKSSINNRSKELSDQEASQKYDLNPSVKISSQDQDVKENRYYSRDVIRSKQGQDSKVEEIRISRPTKEKEVVPVVTSVDSPEKIISRKTLQKNEKEWFEGTDDIRYEIDKLTGEIDEKNVDKWFEGFDDIKNKIDEKIKKKDKTKNNNK